MAKSTRPRTCSRENVLGAGVSYQSGMGGKKHSDKTRDGAMEMARGVLNAHVFRKEQGAGWLCRSSTLSGQGFEGSVLRFLCQKLALSLILENHLSPPHMGTPLLLSHHPSGEGAGTPRGQPPLLGI